MSGNEGTKKVAELLKDTNTTILTTISPRAS